MSLTVGTPVDQNSAGSGYVAPATLHTWFQNTGQAIGWNTGGILTFYYYFSVFNNFFLLSVHFF